MFIKSKKQFNYTIYYTNNYIYNYVDKMFIINKVMMTKIIVGLGNPGGKYQKNKHNVGFKFIDILVKKINLDSWKDKFDGSYIEYHFNDTKIIFAKPMTYMNLSGDFIVKIVNFYKIDIKEDLLIIYDDIDTKIGNYRFKTDGSSGGQKGIKDIINKFNNQNIHRIRIGIGAPDKNIDLANYVLSNFNQEEENKVVNIINKLTDVLKDNLDNNFVNLAKKISQVNNVS